MRLIIASSFKVTDRQYNDNTTECLYGAQFVIAYARIETKRKTDTATTMLVGELWSHRVEDYPNNHDVGSRLETYLKTVLTRFKGDSRVVRHIFSAVNWNKVVTKLAEKVIQIPSP